MHSNRSLIVPGAGVLARTQPCTCSNTFQEHVKQVLFLERILAHKSIYSYIPVSANMTCSCSQQAGCAMSWKNMNTYRYQMIWTQLHKKYRHKNTILLFIFMYKRTKCSIEIKKLHYNVISGNCYQVSGMTNY